MHVTKDDFERLDPSAAVLRTSKLYSRADLLDDSVPLRGSSIGDFIGSAGDFIGRLITLFGAPDPHGGFVLRHRATGLLVTAYSAQSGPAYGGTVVAPPEAAWARVRERWEACNAAALSGTPEAQHAAMAQHAAERDAISREMSDLRAPEGYPALVRALEALIAAMPPTDFERIDKSGGEGAYRVGVRNGVPFQERVRG